MTERSGLKLERIVSPEKLYIIENMGGGAGFLDYDNDGLLDVYLTNLPTVESFRRGQLHSNRLYRNNGDGTFGDTTHRAGVGFRGWNMGVSAADYDNDGDMDIYLTNYGPNVLYRNNGDETFTDVTQQAGVGDPRFSASSGWADFDADGYLDLFVTNYVEFDLENLPQRGEGEYCFYKGFEVHCGPEDFKGAGDGLFRNNGDGTFTDVSAETGVSDEQGYYGLGVAWGDFDLDGDSDLYVANDTNPNYLYWNEGNGVFREAGLLGGTAVSPDGNAQAGMGVAVGDYDNDGSYDVHVTNFSGETNALYRNRGNGTFMDETFRGNVGRVSLPYLGWGTFFADFDNDGWKDLFVANGHVYPQLAKMDVGTHYQQTCLFYLNLRNGKFQNVTAGAGKGVNTPRSYRGAAIGDYDNDGDLDLLVMDLDGGAVLLENRSVPIGNYLRVKAPVGTTVKIGTDGFRQLDEVRASGSYLSASEQVVHFGLGNASVVDELQVQLPDGKTRVLKNIDANKILTIDANWMAENE